MKIKEIISEEIDRLKDYSRDQALEKISGVGGFDNLPDLDKLALLGGSGDDRLKQLSLSKIYTENGGSFGRFNIKVRVKDSGSQPIPHKFSQEQAGKDGWLYPYINYDDKSRPYVSVRFGDFTSTPEYNAGGRYEERPIYLENIYALDYGDVKSEFNKHDQSVDRDREEFMSNFNFD